MQLKQAVEMNDLAHRKTLAEDAIMGKLTRERFSEIEQEAKMWLRHLFGTHNVTKQG